MKDKMTINQLKNKILDYLNCAGELDDAIQKVISLIGEYFDVDRVYIFENSSDDLSASNTFEWCNKGIIPQINNLKDIRYKEDVDGKWIDNYNEDGLFFCPSIETLPEKQRRILKPQNIKSMLHCAIRKHGKFKGFIGFDDCGVHSKGWQYDKDAIDTLVYTSQLLALFLFINRNKLLEEEEIQLKLQEKLKAANTMFEDLLYNVACGVSICRITKDGEINLEFINEGICKIIEGSYDDVAELFKEDKQVFIDEEYRDLASKTFSKAVKCKGVAECTCRVISLLGNRKWVVAKMSGKKNKDGSTLLYNTFFDVTSEMTAQEELLRSEEITEAASDFAGVWVSTYNIDTNEAYPGKRLQREYGMPGKVENFPESIFEYDLISKKYEEVYREACKKIYNGENQVEFEVESTETDKYSHWFRIRINHLSMDNDKANLAVVTIQPIDNEKYLEAKIEMEEKIQTSGDKALLGHFVANLSKNEVVTFSYLEGKLPQRNPLATFEEDSRAGEEFIYDENQKKAFRRLHDPGYLIECYSAGVTEKTIDYRCILPDGRVIWTRNVLHLLRNPKTGEIFNYEYCYDINQQKIIEETLMAALNSDYEYVASILLKNGQMTSLGHSHNTMDGTVVMEDYEKVNREYVKHCVLKEERDIYLIKSDLHEVAKQLKDKDIYEFLYRVRGNDKVHTKRTRYTVYDRKNQVVLITRTDVTEMVKQEEEKREKLQDALNIALRRNLIINTVASHDYDFVMVVDIEANTYEMYSAAVDGSLDGTPLNGQYNKELKRYVERHVIPEDREETEHHMSIEFLKEILAIKEILVTQGRVVDKTGKILHKQAKFSYLDEEHRRILITRVDITDIIEEEEQKRKELTTALKVAEQATKAKTDFLSRMSHDLRTPMNAIIGLSALTIDDAAKPEIVSDNMTKLRSTSNFMLSLINDILDMAKIENGTIELHPAPYAYNDFIMNMKTMFTAQCEQKDVTINFEEPKINPVAYIDKTRLNQIFFNIISNAVKYTKPGGTIDYRTDNLILKGNILSADGIVTDNGIGMSREFQEHMFEAFVQEDDSITPELQGTGLGLSITKQLVEMMDGTIAIESEKGKGTKVTIHLDFPLLSQNEIIVEKKAKVSDYGKVLFDKNILLVEDHPLNARIAMRLLEKQKINVIHAENGKVAVDKFSSSPEGFFDMILMDIRMPEMDGYEATRAIRSLPREDAKTVPIIAMTANAYESDIEESRKAGMNAHLAKPIEPQKLYEAIAGFIAVKNEKI